MKRIIWIISFLIIESNLSAKEMSFSGLLDDYAKKNQINYSISSDIKDFKINIENDDNLKEEDFFKVITALGALNGIGIIISNDKKIFKVINARNANAENLSIYSDESLLPDDYQFVRFSYNAQFVRPKDVTHGIRPMLSRYGRIQDFGVGQKIIISDYAKNIRKLLKIIKSVDNPKTKQYTIEAEKLEEELKNLSASREDFWDVVSKQYGLFIVLFSLIFLIIGFLARGYMIRRLEGGL